MQHRTYRLATLIVAVALALGSFISVSAQGGTQLPSLAAGKVYFVSTTGSDTNAGTASAPFKTFTKAISMLAAGDELQIYGGTYDQQLNVNKSGTSSAPISIKAVPGQTVIIDGAGSRDELVLVPDTTSYVNLSSITCKNATVVCVLLRGSHIKVTNFDVSGGTKFGVRLTGSYITVESSSIHDNVTENLNGTNTTAGWGSALRSAQGSSNNVFRNNAVFHNWGEGIIMGSNTSQVYGNSVHDNYSKNIYVGNTYGVDVYQNITYSTDSKWFRSGNPADCISLSEELISTTYGAQLGNVRVFNNIASNCKTGVGYSYAEVTGNGCNNCLFAFNTITASKNACIKVIDGTKNKIDIADNICSTGSISVPSSGVTVHNNFSGDAHLTGGAISDANSYRPLSGSPVIGAGVDVGISTDYFGVTRSPYDIGAIQAGVSAQAPTPVPPSPTPVVPTATPIVILPTATLIPTATAVVTLPPPTATSQSSTSGTKSTVTYDDKNSVFAYTGTWDDVAASGAYSGSFKKSTAPGQSISMTFNGTSISIIYTKNSTFTKMTVKVDGVAVGTIDEYASSRQLQQIWNLPTSLVAGTHTLTLVYAGTDTTTRVSFDAVTVYSSSTGSTLPQATATLSPSSTAATYDDKNSVFAYGGSWDDTLVSGAYNGSFKRSLVPGQSVTMTFSVTSFSIIYTKNTSFTKMQVIVDGTQVGTIDEYASSRQLQQTWKLPLTLASGTHTLKLVHTGTDTTTRISLDAVTVYP